MLLTQRRAWGPRIRRGIGRDKLGPKSIVTWLPLLVNLTLLELGREEIDEHQAKIPCTQIGKTPEIFQNRGHDLYSDNRRTKWGEVAMDRRGRNATERLDLQKSNLYRLSFILVPKIPQCHIGALGSCQNFRICLVWILSDCGRRNS